MTTATGLDLKLTRVRNHLTLTAVAAQMGLSRQSVHGIERAARPSPERIAQYLAAVTALGDATMTPGAA
jgi:transcriptional regulator with XRE-family HTH domain